MASGADFGWRSGSGKWRPYYPESLPAAVDPNKEISDQYGSIVVVKKDGSQVIGRVMNLNGDNLMLNMNMLDPNAIEIIDQKEVVSIEPSPGAMMPPGLIKTLSNDDVLDLLAYHISISQGDPEHELFH